MKREVSFFKDHRATSASALLQTMRALGMTDAEIKTELKRYQDAQKSEAAQNQNDKQDAQP